MQSVFWLILPSIVGIAALLDSSEPAVLSWETNAYRNSKSIDYEGRYT